MQTIALILFALTYLAFALLASLAVQATALPTRTFAREQARKRPRL